MNNKEIIEEFEQTIPDKLKVGGFVVDEKDLEVEVDFRPLKKPLKELLKKALAQQKQEFVEMIEGKKKISKGAKDIIFLNDRDGKIPVPRGNNRDDSVYNLALENILKTLKQ